MEMKTPGKGSTGTALLLALLIVVLVGWTV